MNSASHTVDSIGSRHLDLNFNTKKNDHEHYTGFNIHPSVIQATYTNVAYIPEPQYTSSNGSRSDSIQQSHEALPEILMTHSYHHDQSYGRSDDADSTLRPQLPPNSSLSLHDLRPAPSRYLDHIPDFHIPVVQR